MARLGHGRRKVPDDMHSTERWEAQGLYVFPKKAPGSGSYPIGDLYHAKLALSGIYAMSGYTPPAKRRAILTAVARAYPEYNWAAYWNKDIKRKGRSRVSKSGRKLYPLYDWNKSISARGKLKPRKAAANPRRNTMARRRRNSGNYLENPLGMPLSGNIQAVIVDEHYRRRRGSAEKSPKRVHIKKGKYALCGAGKGRVVAGPDKGMIKGVKPSDSKAISCYRCLKLHNINRGDDVERMIRAPGRRETHMMVPGGRQGMYISRKQLEHDDYPSRGAQVSGIEYFLGGTDEHPTQSRLLSDKQKRAREDDLRKRRSRRGAARKVTVGAGRGRRMVANPRSYKQGYDRGAGDFHEPEPLPASQLSSRSESYQFGYLEGYSDQAGGKSSRSSRRAASARRSYKPKARAKARRAKPRRRNSGLTDYQRHVQKERRSGKSMKQAAASWRRNGRRR